MPTPSWGGLRCSICHVSDSAHHELACPGGHWQTFALPVKFWTLFARVPTVCPDCNSDDCDATDLGNGICSVTGNNHRTTEYGEEY